MSWLRNNNSIRSHTDFCFAHRCFNYKILGFHLQCSVQCLIDSIRLVHDHYISVSYLLESFLCKSLHSFCTPQSSCMVIAINSIQSGLPTHTVLGLITSFNHPLFNTLTKTHPNPSIPLPLPTGWCFNATPSYAFGAIFPLRWWWVRWSKQMCGWTIVHNKEMVKLEVPTLWLLDFPINNETRHHLPPHPVAVVPAPRPVEALLQSEDPRIQNLMRSTNVQVRLREGCCVDWLLEGWWSLLISMMSWERIRTNNMQDYPTPSPMAVPLPTGYPRCWCCDAPRDSPTNVAPKDSRALRRASSSWRFKVAGIRRIWLVLVVCEH